MKFSDIDFKQIQKLGITSEKVEEQLSRFNNGFPEIKLVKNISENNGLFILSDTELKTYINQYEQSAPQKQLVKFVPASGAASRMFKLLFNYLEGGVDSDDKDIQKFYRQIDQFAFADELLALIENTNEKINSFNKEVVEQLLSEQGLNYGKLPKALLSFHKYDDGTITKAIDEHLIEGALYASDANGKVILHFTVSEEHIQLIEEHLKIAVPIFEKRFNKKYSISFSVQNTATNTLAVDMDNNPFRTPDGNLLFRPGGHGALLQNLNGIDADVIFIKNIDNVAAEWLIKDTIDYKKALGGVLLETQNETFSFCEQLKNTDVLTPELENSISQLLTKKLGYKLPDGYSNLNESDKKDFLFSKLNRPLRICGVVESSNTGGGPFWIKHPDGSQSLQLVETAQINLDDKQQVSILESSCYANITDLFCSVKDYKGKKFDLMQFSDPDTGFICQKSLNGKSLKAMELPGLWNGAMSNWNTCFVRVPMTTFNPVKTVLDLLKKEHQGVS